MAGSSLPVTWRRPELELQLGTKMTEALVASRGELEIYGIHALEALQCMVERRFPVRRGTLDPDPPNRASRPSPACKATRSGRRGTMALWSWELLEHALGRSPSRNAGDIRANCRRFQRPATWGNFVPKGPIAFHDRVPRRPEGHGASTRRPRRRRDLRGAASTARRSRSRACSGCRRRPAPRSSKRWPCTSRSSWRPASRPTPSSERSSPAASSTTRWNRA